MLVASRNPDRRDGYRQIGSLPAEIDSEAKAKDRFAARAPQSARCKRLLDFHGLATPVHTSRHLDGRKDFERPLTRNGAGRPLEEGGDLAPYSGH